MVRKKYRPRQNASFYLSFSEVNFQNKFSIQNSLRFKKSYTIFNDSIKAQKYNRSIRSNNIEYIFKLIS